MKVEARIAPWSHFAASAMALLPLESQHVSRPEGDAALDARIFGGLVHFVPLELGRVFVDVGLGAGAAVVTMSGSARSPLLTGKQSSVATAVGLGVLGLGVRALPFLAFRLDLTTGIAARRPVVRFAEQDVAAWGPVFAAATAGVEVDAVEIAREFSE
jgi:hypothetical protein